jgi:hypothetical protein
MRPYCVCGQPFTIESWDALPMLGYQEAPDDFAFCDCSAGTGASNHSLYCAGRGYRLALRNCPSCGTTMAEKE